MVYYLSLHVVVIKKKSGDCIAYNRNTRRKYLINEPMFDFLVELVNGCDIDSEIDSKNLVDPYVLTFLIKEKIIVSNIVNKATLFNIKDLSQSSLEKITVEITSACNLKCKHCYGDFGKNKMFLDEASLEQLFEQAANIGVYDLAITGGEPFLYPRLSNILKKAYSYGMVITLFSNLVLFDEDKYDTIFPYIYKVITSIESHNEIVHDMFRGYEGAFQKTVNAVKYLCKKNIIISTNLVVGQHNYDNILDTAKFIISLGSDLVVDYISCEGRAKNLDIDSSKIETALIAIKKYFNIISNELNCGIGERFVYIRSTGEIVLCPSLYDECFVFGNIYENYDLLKVWYKIISNINITCCDNKNCKCNGGCRARSYNITGNINAPDKMYCKLFKNET